MNVEGGAALPIVLSSEIPGGGNAIPVYIYTSATLGNRRLEGGPAQRVYLVSDAEIAAGTFKVEGLVTAIPVYVVTDGRKVTGEGSTAVYVVSP